MNPLAWARDIGGSGFLDITIMSLLLYTVLVFIAKSRAGFVLRGIVILAGMYLVIRQMNLSMTARVLENFFAITVIAIVVMFQEELRHFFEQLAVWSLKRPRRAKTVRFSRPEIETLVRTLSDLAREKIGALVVLRGRDLLIRHTEGGTHLDGRVSEALLKSLFDPHSLGHDGAVLIEGDRVTEFSVHLPLSKNLELLSYRGTRHAAALGLAELTDALCLVVSEERGTLSAAQNAAIETVPSPERLARLLENFYDRLGPKRTLTWSTLSGGYLKENWREKMIAVALAFGLWIVLVDGPKTAYRTYRIPVSAEPASDAWVIRAFEPREIEAQFHGPRSAFYFVRRDQIGLRVKARSKKGALEVPVSAENFSYPKNLVLDRFEPRSIQVTAEKKGKNP
jgi:uncharacterized protein (TIGR00159 family)